MTWLQILLAILAGINVSVFVVGGAWYNAGMAVTVGLMALIMGEDE